jgi:hypothetical protein
MPMTGPLAYLGLNLAVAGNLRGAYIRGHIFACVTEECHCNTGDLSKVEGDGIEDDWHTRPETVAIRAAFGNWT